MGARLASSHLSQPGSVLLLRLTSHRKRSLLRCKYFPDLITGRHRVPSFTSFSAESMADSTVQAVKWMWRGSQCTPGAFSTQPIRVFPEPWAYFSSKKSLLMCKEFPGSIIGRNPVSSIFFFLPSSLPASLPVQRRACIQGD